MYQIYISLWAEVAFCMSATMMQCNLLVPLIITKLKIFMMQVARLLRDTALLQFYPTLFSLVTDILGMLGDMVWERIKRKAEFSEDGFQIHSFRGSYPILFLHYIWLIPARYSAVGTSSSCAVVSPFIDWHLTCLFSIVPHVFFSFIVVFWMWIYLRKDHDVIFSCDSFYI